MMDFLDVFLSIISLIILEIILGIDNLVFLSILTEKLPVIERDRARYWGLTFAWVTRIMLLASAVWLAKLEKPFVSISHFSFSIRDLFLFLGGCFLIVKATQEIHSEVEPLKIKKALKHQVKKATLRGIVIQIGLMDIIFSLDSVMTAVGLTNNFPIMAVAITCSIIVMIYASKPVGQFIEHHPTIKMLALSFLILIGTLLVADSFSFHIPRGYLYFAMGFSMGVEVLNILKRSKR